VRVTLPRLAAVRYLQPLREGGSLPAVLQTGDGLWVVKFRGAGQGPRALIAELVAGLVADAIGLPVPALAEVVLQPGFGAEQQDPEIRELLEASVGTNVGLRYMDGAFNYDASAAGDLIDPELAAAIVWLDAYLTNPDRTARNPNLMVWQRRPWLIDHGSALYAHHDWASVDEARTRTPFALIRQHVLLLRADGIDGADARCAAQLTRERLVAIMDAVPEALLMDPLARGEFTSVHDARARYVAYLCGRVAAPRAFVAEAVRAQEARRAEPPQRLETRR
jgi:hypothetical protein